jgi:hypothetical protein
MLEDIQARIWRELTVPDDGIVDRVPQEILNELMLREERDIPIREEWPIRGPCAIGPLAVDSIW